MSERPATSIVSVSLPKRLAREMDDAAEDLGYASRSELVRDAVRGFLSRLHTLEGAQGHLEGVITLLYDHGRGARVSEVRHRYMGLFRSFMHSDFASDRCTCCEVLVFSSHRVEGSAVRISQSVALLLGPLPYLPLEMAHHGCPENDRIDYQPTKVKDGLFRQRTDRQLMSNKLNRHHRR